MAVERACEKGVSAQVETLSHVAEESREKAFDHVVVSEVIEHVSRPEEFVLKAWSLTSESLIITFPNIGYWPHRLRLLMGRFPVQWAHHPGEHLRFWTIPDFWDWLEELNLSGNMTLSLYPTNGITILHLHRVWPNFFSNQVVIEIEKHDSSKS